MPDLTAETLDVQGVKFWRNPAVGGMAARRNGYLGLYYGNAITLCHIFNIVPSVEEYAALLSLAATQDHHTGGDDAKQQDAPALRIHSMSAHKILHGTDHTGGDDGQ